MAKLVEKLWNWGHLEGSHNAMIADCKMTPEEFAEVYGIRNSFIVSYGGNIQPPFDDLAKRFSVLNEVKWSVLGDASTPIPDAELGNTEDIIDVLTPDSNITGGVVDDFFSPKRMERFPVEVLKKIKKRLNDAGRDFWCVLYSSQLDLDLEKYMDCFDGVTFWVWACKDIVNIEEYFAKLKKFTKDKPVMLGIYQWDYSLPDGGEPMDISLYEKQLSYYFDLLKKKEIDGVVFCSSTLGDAKLETNDMLKKYIADQGDIVID